MNLIYPPEIKNATAFPAWMQFDIFERTSIRQSSAIDTICLYMPEKFANPNTVSWDTDPKQLLGGAIAAHRSGALGDAVSSWDAAANAAKVVMSAAPQWGATAADTAATGGAFGAQILNPFLTMVFRGVDFRTFEFQFKFSPKDEGQSNLIHDIIKLFRKSALPDFRNSGSILGYPAEFQIAYKFMDNDNEFIHKFKRSVITNIDVDYTGAGMFSMHRNGMPAFISLNLRFSEIEIVVAQDIDEGF